MSEQKLNLIKTYMNNGWKITPVREDEKRPFKKGWQKDPIGDWDTARAYYERNPEHNVAIVTGSASNLIVIDVDVKNDAKGAESLAKLETEYGELTTYSVETPSGGKHFYFILPKGVGTIGNSVNTLPGIDIRAENGCVIAPPSTTPKGEYKILHDGAVEEMPQDLLQALTSLPDDKETDSPFEDNEFIKEGGRNNSVHERGCGLKRNGFNDDEIRERLHKMAKEECVPPLSEYETNQILTSVLKYTYDENNTELGNSKRFASQHGINVRYIHPFKKWLIYNQDTGVWNIDDNEEIIRLSLQTIDAMWKEAADCKNSSVRKAKEKHAKYSENSSAINAMIKLAQADPIIASVKPDYFDPHIDHVACKNAFIDLKTGETRPVERKDLVTKNILTDYDAEAICPRWHEFMMEICCGNEELYKNMQRISGYCLTGETRQQELFILLGPGANGKSTYLNIMGALLGELCITTPIQTFVTQDGHKIPNDIARMQSRRLILTSEADENMVFSEPLIKMLTGQDRIPARYLYGEFFEFTPQFKILMAVNHLPKIKGNDPAIWRRFKIIPFKADIPRSKQDPELINKLKAELPGIFNWCVAGAVDWYANGMNYCDAILRETLDYKEDMDSVSVWLKQGYERDDQNHMTLQELHKDFSKWGRDYQRPWVGKKEFSKIMQEKGFRKSRTGGETVLHGINYKGANTDAF